jgi:ABC-type bacteriocin/lantibiotic exporter with double-glycine peptidase domain
MKINLPKLMQQTPQTCLPACVRIVLHYYKQEYSEESIAKACKVNLRGARFEVKLDSLSFYKAWTARGSSGLVIECKN